MARLDETFDESGTRVSYQQWPDTPDGQMDDNGTLRPLTEEEKWFYEESEAEKVQKMEAVLEALLEP